MGYSPEAKAKIEGYLSEDVGFGDITTESLLAEGTTADADIIAKSYGIVAGIREASTCFSMLNCKVKPFKRDGDQVQEGEKVLRVSGPASSILLCERVALNLIMRMSGIATITHQFVDVCRKINPRLRVASTRKTAPGLRLFDKRAIQLGGGDPHRLRLDDCLLIKDNHLRIVGSVERAVRKAKEAASFTKKIEVEVSSLKDAVSAAKSGADIIMIDNLPPSSVRRIVQSLVKKKLRDGVLLEVSGGITLENLPDYAKTGVDILSSGALTHSAKALNVSLEIAEVHR